MYKVDGKINKKQSLKFHIVWQHISLCASMCVGTATVVKVAMRYCKLLLTQPP